MKISLYMPFKKIDCFVCVPQLRSKHQEIQQTYFSQQSINMWSSNKVRRGRSAPRLFVGPISLFNGSTSYRNNFFHLRFTVFSFINKCAFPYLSIIILLTLLANIKMKHRLRQEPDKTGLQSK